MWFLANNNNTIFASPKGSWAIVTGAGSGIGRDIARDLCRRGFNVVLHGRDAERLEKVAKELRETYNVETRNLILDAESAFTSDSMAKSQQALNELSTLNLRVLVNNVGIGHNPAIDLKRFQDQAPLELAKLINVNITFMTFVTHTLLPILQKTGTQGDPSFIINACSLSELGLPWFSVYSGTKAYMSTFSRALDAEMKGEKQHVNVVGPIIGDTNSDGHPSGVSFFTPSSADMAKMVIDSASQVDGGPVVAYWRHKIQYTLCIWQPWTLLRQGLVSNIGDLRERMSKLK